MRLHRKVGRQPLPYPIREEFRVDLRPTYRNENRSESARVRSSVRGTAKIVATLDEVRPWKSLVWDARFEPICVAPSIPVGRVVARDGVCRLFSRVLPLPHQEEAMSYKIAGIDVHKKVLMVVVMDASTPESKPERRRFTTMPSDLRRLLLWLREQGVEEAVMESTAQYWRSVWLELEPYMRLQLAQAFSNRAPRGRKHDFKDAERLVRRLIADELILSFVPHGEQRTWRNMTRMKTQLTRDRVRLQNQMECLLEEMRIKLSIVVSDLLGGSGLRILSALAQGETDPKMLAQLGDERLQCTEEQLVDALTGRVQPMHRTMLALQLQRLQLIDQQIAQLNGLIAQAMKPH